VITREQYEFLASAIQASRIQHLRGQSHLEAWDVRRHLIRIFGFGGWDTETLELAQVAQIQHEPKKPGDKPRWTVVYRAQIRLIVKDGSGCPIAHFDDGASGDSCNQPSLGDAHDQAMKTALSQALKRCAVNLGDQFGLGLYNGGRPDPVVLRTLGAPGPVAVGAAAVVPVDPPVQPEPGIPVVESPESVPAPAPVPAGKPMLDSQRKAIFAAFTRLGRTDPDAQREWLSWVAGRPLASRGDLTEDEARKAIAELNKRQAAQQTSGQEVAA
jgi:Rad52/22 family double-strand break repair protein